MQQRLRSRQVVVVVRLLVDARWRLLHGELVDVHDNSRGRFAGWAGIAPALRRFLTEEHRAGETTKVTDPPVGRKSAKRP